MENERQNLWKNYFNRVTLKKSYFIIEINTLIIVYIVDLKCFMFVDVRLSNTHPSNQSIYMLAIVGDNHEPIGSSFLLEINLSLD